MEDATVSVAFRQRVVELQAAAREARWLGPRRARELLPHGEGEWCLKVGGIILQDVEYFDQ